MKAFGSLGSTVGAGRGRWTGLAKVAVALALLALPIAAHADPFRTDSSLYVSQGSGNRTQLYRVDRSTLPFTLVPIGPKAWVEYNAIGFNPVDKYIYGLRPRGKNRGKIVRIHSDGSLDHLGKPAGWSFSENTWYSATFLEDGTYVVLADDAGEHIARVDVNAAGGPTVLGSFLSLTYQEEKVASIQKG